MSERSDREFLEKQFQELLQAEKAHLPHAAAPPKKRRPEPPKLVRDVAKQRPGWGASSESYECLRSTIVKV